MSWVGRRRSRNWGKRWRSGNEPASLSIPVNDRLADELGAALTPSDVTLEVDMRLIRSKLAALLAL